MTWRFQCFCDHCWAWAYEISAQISHSPYRICELLIVYGFQALIIDVTIITCVSGILLELGFAPCAQPNTVHLLQFIFKTVHLLLYILYSTKGKYMFSLAGLDHPVDLFD